MGSIRLRDPRDKRGEMAVVAIEPGVDALSPENQEASELTRNKEGRLVPRGGGMRCPA